MDISSEDIHSFLIIPYPKHGSVAALIKWTNFPILTKKESLVHPSLEMTKMTKVSFHANQLASKKAGRGINTPIEKHLDEE